MNSFDGVIPIEVKSGNVRNAQNLNIFLRRYQPPKAYIFAATTLQDNGVVTRSSISSTGIGNLGNVPVV